MPEWQACQVHVGVAVKVGEVVEVRIGELGGRISGSGDWRWNEGVRIREVAKGDYMVKVVSEAVVSGCAPPRDCAGAAI